MTVAITELPPALASMLGSTGDLLHLEQALTHPSFANERKRGPRVDYQRLEFLGDAVLGLCVSEALVARFPEAREGELSFLRASIVSTEALAAFGRVVDVGTALRLGRGADAAGERDQSNVVADAVEAIIGAVYLDRGLEAARAIVQRVVDQGLAHTSTKPLRDAKSELQEHVQAKGGASPIYRLLTTEGPEHARKFMVSVEGLGRVLGQGSGRSKKAAEQAAARAGLDGLEAEHDRE